MRNLFNEISLDDGVPSPIRYSMFNSGPNSMGNSVANSPTMAYSWARVAQKNAGQGQDETFSTFRVRSNVIEEYGNEEPIENMFIEMHADSLMEMSTPGYKHQC